MDKLRAIEYFVAAAEEGSFSGKGLIDVASAHATLIGRLPEGQVLSHDLIEGCLLRCAAVTDISLLEEAPFHADVAAATRRMSSKMSARVAGRAGSPTGQRSSRTRATAAAMWADLGIGVYVVGAVVATAVSFTRPVMGSLLPQLTHSPTDLVAANVVFGLIGQFGAFVVGAIFTPPDVVSQLLLAVPLWLLYELGILLARFALPPAVEGESEPEEA